LKNFEQAKAKAKAKAKAALFTFSLISFFLFIRGEENLDFFENSIFPKRRKKVVIKKK